MATSLLTLSREEMKRTIAAALSEASDAAVVCLERAVYNYTVGLARAQPKVPSHQLYAASALRVVQALQWQVGPFPDDVLGVMYERGDLSAASLLEASSQGEAPAPDPREVMRRMYLKLLGTHAGFAGDRPRALEVAREIEMSCYNAAVRASKDSEEPPRRQWDSLAFVEIYSARCGVISSHLNPNSSSCRAYGATLVSRLAAGDILPAALGAMKATELCPQATVTERAEIAKRVNQKVQIKPSELFACPFCKKRNCTWQEVQRRSLDEAPDYLCLCLEEGCGHRFKGHS